MYVAITVFFSVVSQSLTGFGLALISMPILARLLGIRTATPLVALIAIIIEAILTFYYRSSFNFKAVRRLILAYLIGIPIGIMGLKYLEERIILPILGVIIVGYSIYALLNLKLPRLEHSIWAYIFGFVTGLFSGAYNVAGPTVIVYGNCRRWKPAEFKSNLQGFFLAGSLTAIPSHWLSGNFSSDVWQNLLISLPAMALGLIVGLSLDRFLNPENFRVLVLILLIILGVSLIF
jgi:uncharacterized membrane protein YfcA